MIKLVDDDAVAAPQDRGMLRRASTASLATVDGSDLHRFDSQADVYEDDILLYLVMEKYPRCLSDVCFFLDKNMSRDMFLSTMGQDAHLAR